MQLKLKNELVKQEVKAALAAETEEYAEIVGLIYVSDKTPGIKRQRKGKGFCYYDAEGNKICCEDELNRIKALVMFYNTSSLESSVDLCQFLRTFTGYRKR